MPAVPTPERKLRAMMLRQAILEGHAKGVMPEVGHRIALKPDTVRAIRRLAGEGCYCCEIARVLGLTEQGIRRYAKDYGITLPKHSGGGAGLVRLGVIRKRRERVARLLARGWTQRRIAAHLGMSTFTICQDAQYVRERGLVPAAKDERHGERAQHRPDHADQQAHHSAPSSTALTICR